MKKEKLKELDEKFSRERRI